jgi:hypothetical protein
MADLAGDLHRVPWVLSEHLADQPLGVAASVAVCRVHEADARLHGPA